ncbi:MAG: hypothetical protein BWY78_00849 [Alphaproteobacteria bacterium ADurb.Bin438]|nr:MAG: hypothetical protein BWY78_00849 [Alphaproteobacteria bacterium ADurb.Bin438]
MSLDKEGAYDVVINVNKELLFCIRSRNGTPNNPRFFYDGGEHAILYRDAKRSILLEYLPKEVIKLLPDLDKVLVAEIENDELKNEYFAAICKIRKLPI